MEETKRWEKIDLKKKGNSDDKDRTLVKPKMRFNRESLPKTESSFEESMIFFCIPFRRYCN